MLGWKMSLRTILLPNPVRRGRSRGRGRSCGQEGVTDFARTRFVRSTRPDQPLAFVQDHLQLSQECPLGDSRVVGRQQNSRAQRWRPLLSAPRPPPRSALRPRPPPPPNNRPFGSPAGSGPSCQTSSRSCSILLTSTTSSALERASASCTRPLNTSTGSSRRSLRLAQEPRPVC